MCHLFLPLVSIFGLFPVLVSCHYELSMFQLCLSRYVLIIPCILVLSFEFDVAWSTCDFPLYLVSLPCLVVIKYYYLSLRPRLRVPVPPSCVHHDRRPDLNSKRRPFTSFCFVNFLKSFYFVPVFLCVCPAAWKSPLVIPTIAHCKSAWEFGGIAVSATSPLAASPHARRSREISGGGSPKPASDSMPAGPPLTQCPPARL